MKVNGMKPLTREMAKDSKSGLMVLSMKDTGRMIKPTEEADLFMQMEMYTKVSGKTTRLTVMEDICTQMVLSMKVSGKKTSNMVKVKRHGQMVPVTRETMLKVKKMVSANSNGLMGQHMKGSSLTTTFMEEVSMCGLTIDATMASG